MTTETSVTQQTQFSKEFINMVNSGWSALNYQMWKTNPEGETISNLKTAIQSANFQLKTNYVKADVIRFMFDLD